MKNRCEACGHEFIPYPTVPHQKYCSRKECQKKRKNEWRRKKMASDEDYKANQGDAQKRWYQKNQDYQEKYRQSHPEYVEKNRELQKERNRRRKSSLEERSTSNPIVKSDELKVGNKDFPGYYVLKPLKDSLIVKSDALIVKIDVITRGYGSAS